jgi:hypothetical protein
MLLLDAPLRVLFIVTFITSSVLTNYSQIIRQNNIENFSLTSGLLKNFVRTLASENFAFLYQTTRLHIQNVNSIRMYHRESIKYLHITGL